jgi:hypothetical protein
MSLTYQGEKHLHLWIPYFFGYLATRYRINCGQQGTGREPQSLRILPSPCEYYLCHMTEDDLHSQVQRKLRPQPTES